MTTRRVLVAEDNALVMMSLEALIEDMEWTLVGPAETLADAESLAGDCEADIALLDVNLNGERSIGVAETLAGRGIPVIFATGYGDALDLPPALEGSPVVTKPFRLDELESLLRERCGRS
ncbi:hypothetical protein B5C34_11105 [Pacificimonas flava]|uniref:Response regulatory domain-containing protein n=2 Tax=Pacificimonas TaxID=1960290 RepID=A0A219B702_9SPHN|nr:MULTISPECIES: response regulator [Pacificimonas]MBZ6378784.1 response regulator [Pacificimonas aurantium]OWV33954.1 hypothetical protein B5C34_11105 [Pacificimonas flava]